ncbi:hypothetical protein [Hydromonas duriensis]|uniref:Uncharacterized protein n=1 Tax=Hydromonas duriensis TaxID=1527608 RepID=A0A4R6YBK9_9BURK|nr:hypothetical protein [Hydromonas duriensis]TDR33035.1 hypothetical protein DFR44_10185 [Hydromonas duriensis]
MNRLFIHQIFYNETTRQHLDPGFIPLNNLRNERPDWYEFWPIYQYLRAHLNTMDEQDYYGFLSPNFTQKMGLSSTDVIHFIHQRFQPDVDAYVLSPFWDQIAFFRNVFEQGEFWHQGLMDLSSQFFQRVGIQTNLSQLITHSQNTAYCNYIIAKPRFWRRWLWLAEQLFEMVETGKDDFSQQLSGATFYRKKGVYPMKTFVQERLATFILATEDFQTVAYDTFSLPASLAMENNPYCLTLLACDAYKQAFLRTGNRTFEGAFALEQQRITPDFLKNVR